MSMVTEERITNKITTRLQGREGKVSVKGGAYNYAVAARAGSTGIIRMVETRKFIVKSEFWRSFGMT